MKFLNGPTKACSGQAADVDVVINRMKSKRNKKKQALGLVKDWLDHSPIISLLVAFAGIAGFIISTSVGIYTIHKEIAESRLAPVVSIFGLSLQRNSMELSYDILSVILGPDRKKESSSKSDVSDSEIIMEAPYYQAVIIATNPRNVPVTIQEFRLVLTYQDGAIYPSYSYTLLPSTNSNESLDQPLYLQPHEVVKRDINFIFHPGHYLSSDSETIGKGRYIVSVYLSWEDDHGVEYKSAPESFPKGALGMGKY